MPYVFDVESALEDTEGNPGYGEIYQMLIDIEEIPSPWDWNVRITSPKEDGLRITTGSLSDEEEEIWIEIRVDPKTGKFIFSFSDPPRGEPVNPFHADDVMNTFSDLYRAHVYNPEGEVAKERGREAQGLAKVMKPGDEGLEVGNKYLPPGVPANIASFLTGERGSVKQQMATLRAETGKGRRKARKTRKSKSRSIRRKSRKVNRS